MPEGTTKPKAWDGITKLSFSPDDLMIRSIPPRGSMRATTTTVTSVTTARIITDRTAKDDYRQIMQALDRMVWKGNFGPTVYVETKLTWKNQACQELYLKVKAELQDKPIPGTNLFYYVGAIGNWGKAGFRITGHTKKSDRIKASETCGVLHVDNS